MYSRSLLAVFVAAIVPGAIPATTRAELPPDQTVYYKIRETPKDPESDVVFVLQLEVEAVDSDGDWIGWEVTTLEIRKPPGTGQSWTIWTENSPSVDTTDGLWRIEHADPQAPKLSEFLEPPLIEGTVAAEDPSNPDMEYSVDGVVYQAPALPGGPPFAPTGALDYVLTYEGEEEPAAEGPGPQRWPQTRRR